ncbi:MAG: alpha/beta hydrolase [Bacteroidia bacterium]
MKKILFLFSIIIFMSSCLRLDNNLFNGDITITEYKFDGFAKGELGDLYNNPAYAIPDSMINLFTLTSNDNGNTATIYAEFIGNVNTISTDTIIMYCHGNKWHMDNYWNRTKLFANVGGRNRFGVMTFDYRGYGRSSGTSTESSMYADGDACLKWLQSKGLTSNRLIIYGYSLGSATATELTANPRTLSPCKLCLESPFSSTEAMTSDAAGISLPASYVTNIKIDNIGKIRKVNQPFLWMHGIADDFLKIETHGQAVFNNYRGVKGIAVKVPGAVHNNVPSVLGYGTYMNTLLNFITSN